MRKPFAFLTAAVLLLAFAVPVTRAGDQGTNCPTDPERVRFYENTIGDTSDGNDTVIFCGLGASDLSQIEHTLPGGCKDGIFKTGDNWEDCISSMYAVIPAGRVLCLYGDKNFGGAYRTEIDAGTQYANTRVNLTSIPGGFNDGMSSWHFLDDGPQFFGC